MRAITGLSWLVLTVTAVPLIAACGSSTGEAPAAPSVSSSSTPTLSGITTQVASGAAGTVTATEYATKANAICAAGTTKADALGNGPGDPTAVTAVNQLPPFATYLTAQANIIATEVMQLHALPTSAATATRVQAAYTDIDQAVVSMRTAAAAAKSKDLTTYRAAIAAVITETRAANSAATAAGLTTCGS